MAISSSSLRVRLFRCGVPSDESAGVSDCLFNDSVKEFSRDSGLEE